MNNKLNINNLKWKIEYLNKNDERLKLNNYFCSGITYYETNKIYISNSLNEDQRKRTLIHELTHAVLYSYSVSDLYKDTKKSQFSEEQVCEIMASYCEFINKEISR